MERYAQELIKENETAVEPPMPVVFEVELLKKDGTLFFAELNGGFLRDTNGKPCGILGVLRDISERRRFEEQLQEVNTELEGYAHTVSHDLRGPLSTVVSSCFTLQDLLGQFKEMDGRLPEYLRGGGHCLPPGLQSERPDRESARVGRICAETKEGRGKRL